MKNHEFMKIIKNKTTQGPSSVVRRRCPPSVVRRRFFEIFVQVLSKEYVLKTFVQVSSKVLFLDMFKTCLKLQHPFSQGVQKEEIQQ